MDQQIINKIIYKKLNSKAIIPTKRVGDAGYDLYSTEDLNLNPFERRAISTGLAIQIPDGFYGKICDKSGLALKNGLHVMGGTIDSTYTGDIKVVLINLNTLEFILSLVNNTNQTTSSFNSLFGVPGSYRIKAGEKIAQIVFRKYHDVSFEEGELQKTERGDGGFGSTGLK